MTNAELRAAVVVKALSREGKNQYTQGAKRTQVGSGWSDCSSFVRWVCLQVLGIDIGLNTAAQITNKRLVNVADVDKLGGKAPPEKDMERGDLIYYKGSDKSRPRGCGHVEMYIGNGKIIGHGSGKGPTVKNLCDYSTQRANNGRGWLCVLRAIGGATAPASYTLGERALPMGSKGDDVRELQKLLIAQGYAPNGAKPNGDYAKSTAKSVRKAQKAMLLVVTGDADKATIAALIAKSEGRAVTLPGQDVEVCGGTAYIRSGPSTRHEAIAVTKSGDVHPASGEAASGWIGIQYKAANAWISAKYAEIVGG